MENQSRIGKRPSEKETSREGPVAGLLAVVTFAIRFLPGAWLLRRTSGHELDKWMRDLKEKSKIYEGEPRTGASPINYDAAIEAAERHLTRRFHG